jgi:hypothetical protein
VFFATTFKSSTYHSTPASADVLSGYYYLVQQIGEKDGWSSEPLICSLVESINCTPTSLCTCYASNVDQGRDARLHEDIY